MQRTSVSIGITEKRPMPVGRFSPAVSEVLLAPSVTRPVLVLGGDAAQGLIKPLMSAMAVTRKSVTVPSHQNINMMPGLQAGNTVENPAVPVLALTCQNVDCLKKTSIWKNVLEPMNSASCLNACFIDRGSEFDAPKALGIGVEGIQRTSIYYCGPMGSGRKGSVENAHIMLRMVFPKGECEPGCEPHHRTPRKSLDGNTSCDAQWKHPMKMS